MSKSIIKNFIAKMVAGRSDDGIMITLSDPRKVDLGEKKEEKEEKEDEEKQE